MKEPYVEGLASHRGPGSYADSREAVGGALIGVRTGWDDEPRNQSSRRRRRRRGRRKAILSPSLGETGWGTRGQRPHACAETLCLNLGDLQPPHGQGRRGAQREAERHSLWIATRNRPENRLIAIEL